MNQAWIDEYPHFKKLEAYLSAQPWIRGYSITEKHLSISQYIPRVYFRIDIPGCSSFHWYICHDFKEVKEFLKREEKIFRSKSCFRE